ncbi:hypothetical protein QIU18_13135 [Capnocytophaga canimorsus]|nr:hypothetical protein [Capnocytophaga canimorsus]WGU70362.1 hypothetical protein QIU18_13135 [Capnocytophaga canimorsus]
MRGAAMAATQANELIKELVNPTEGIMKVALGNPQVETVYVETYPALDASAFEQQKQPPFLAARQHCARCFRCVFSSLTNKINKKSKIKNN